MEVNKIIQFNVMKRPWPLADCSVNCIVTSPPYWGLRDYGVPGQLGLEQSPEEYVANIVLVFKECFRVLKPEGTLWLNLGDSYANGRIGRDDQQKFYDRTHGYKSKALESAPRRHIPKNLKPKDLVGIPWMVAFALRSAGWYLRQDIIWNKPNPMPESVTDRCTKSHEYIFLLSKSSKYYFDQNAIRVPLKDESIARLAQDIEKKKGSDRVPGKTNGSMKAVVKGHRIGGTKYGDSDDPLHRNKSGKDWEVKMAGSGGINSCGRSGYHDANGKLLVGPTANKKSVWTVTTKPFKDAHFATFPEQLITDCIKAGCPLDGVVFDPFMGAGTTAVVAMANGRKFFGMELNPAYIEIAESRLKKEFGMFYL